MEVRNRHSHDSQIKLSLWELEVPRCSKYLIQSLGTKLCPNWAFFTPFQSLWKYYNIIGFYSIWKMYSIRYVTFKSWNKNVVPHHINNDLRDQTTFKLIWCCKVIFKRYKIFFLNAEFGYYLKELWHSKNLGHIIFLFLGLFHLDNYVSVRLWHSPSLEKEVNIMFDSFIQDDWIVW